jgi:hypothetical protein
MLPASSLREHRAFARKQQVAERRVLEQPRLNRQLTRLSAVQGSPFCLQLTLRLADDVDKALSIGQEHRGNVVLGKLDGDNAV